MHETRRYDRAEAALLDEQTAIAVDELCDDLRVYPTGSLRDEARLSLLDPL